MANVTYLRGLSQFGQLGETYTAASFSGPRAQSGACSWVAKEQLARDMPCFCSLAAALLVSQSVKELLSSCHGLHPRELCVAHQPPFGNLWTKEGSQILVWPQPAL